jgi:hypothetical protein
MATKLQKAIAFLEAAMGDRPWVLLYDPIHRDSENVGFMLHKSDGIAPYELLGLLRMGDDAAKEIIGGTQVEQRAGRREPVGEKLTDRRAREIECLNILGLVVDFSPMCTEEIFNEVAEWDDARLAEALAFATGVHNKTIATWAKPSWMPADWTVVARG